VKTKSSERFEDRIERGARDHYQEASYYTKNYAKRSHDVAYYVELGRLYGCEVLEYGCGNGRIAYPMAARGNHVVGIDLSQPMLDDFKGRLADADSQIQERVELVHGDMRQVRLNRKFGLVLCTFNTFLHLYTRSDVERFLGCVKAHMQADARFVFDVSMPCPKELAREPERAYSIPKLRYPKTGQLVRYSENFDYDQQTQVLFVTMRFEPLDKPKSAFTHLLTHRQFYPQELEALLHYNGFEIESAVSDFGDEPLGQDTDSAVYTVRLAKAHS